MDVVLARGTLRIDRKKDGGSSASGSASGGASSSGGGASGSWGYADCAAGSGACAG